MLGAGGRIARHAVTMLAKTGSIKSVVALVANIANDPGYGSRTNLGVDKPGSDDGDRLAFM